VLLVGCGDPEFVRPNVLLILLDDFGYNDLAANNDSDSPTPNLDRIARAGVRFTRHYSESTCSPSRAALLTGQYAARVGYHPNGTGLADEIVTLPEFLSAQGYSSSMFGKWHLGDAYPEVRPERHGFDQWLGFLSQNAVARALTKAGRKWGWPSYFDPWLEDESGTHRQYKGHLNDILTRRAINRITETEDAWFIFLSYRATHHPVEASPRFAEKFEDSAAGRYQALKAQVDANIGRLFDHLAESGRLDDTLIIIVSDNGGTNDVYPSNAPYYGKKTTYFEGGVRTPLIMHWPARFKAPRVIDEAVMIADLYPTIAGLVGAPPPEGLDGVDIFSEHPPREFYWYAGISSLEAFRIQSADWSLLEPSLYMISMSRALIHVSHLEAPEQHNEIETRGPLAEELYARFESWRDEVTRVSSLTARTERGTRIYTGDDFRRTPTENSYTFGLTLKTGARKAATHQRVAWQRGYLEIRYSGSPEQITVTIDGNSTAFPFRLADHSCTSLIVTNILIKKNEINKRKSSTSKMSIYLNGRKLSESNYATRSFSRQSPSNPLRIATNATNPVYMPGTSDPLILTRTPTEQEIAEKYHPELVAACQPQ
jgi:arylsulfatase A-like enzyme